MSKNHVLAMQKNTQQTLSYLFANGLVFSFAVIVTFLIALNPAHADLVGGLNAATSTTSTAVKAFYALVGAGIVGWLLWEALGLLQGRMDWKEFAVSCGKVALIGGVIILAPTLWDFFKNGGF